MSKSEAKRLVVKKLLFPYQAFGRECGEGWWPLIDELIEDLKKLGWDGQITQIKEKFGGLRFYISEGSMEIFDRIAKAEADSYHICEVCGESGKLRGDLSWAKTLCDIHYKERKTLYLRK